MRKDKYVYKSELNAIKKIMPEFSCGIEIGVGTARFSKPLGIQIGIDPSEEMLTYAKKRQINVVKAIGENIPFKDNSFDMVLIVTTICFLDDIEKTLKELGRILDDKKSIIIGYIDKNSSLGKIYQEKQQNNLFYKNAVFVSTGEVLEKLKIGGFNEFKIVQTIYNSIDEIEKIQKTKNGYGEGSFVCIKATKN